MSSLLEARKPLEAAIKIAFEKAKETGKNAKENDNSEKILKDLSSDLADAIHKYVLSAKVDISNVQSVVSPGQAVLVVFPAGTGATSVPSAPAKHAGFGVLK